MTADALQDSGFVCKVQEHSSLHWQDVRGRMRSTVRPSDNTVLTLTRTQHREGTTIHFVSELILELRQGFATNAPLAAEHWVVFAVYRQGGPVLQFESTSCRGEVRVGGAPGALTGHGHVHLTFFEPRKDISHLGEVALDFDF
jgi:hypothetical protein